MAIRELLQGATGRTKTILIIEAIVGVLILIGGIFVLAKETKAPVLRSESPSPSFAGQAQSTYISSPLQISLRYPYGWQIDPTFNGIPGIERYTGADGYFEVDATNDPTPRKGRLILRYPKAITLGTTRYRYFVLKADAAHLKSIGDTVEFLNK